MAIYAYIRVSTKEQNIDRQLLSIASYDVPKKNIFCDWQSGKDFNRPSYNKLKKVLKKGDLLIVKSIDRFGRNYNDILVEWQDITKRIGADIFVLDMELLDTRKKNNLTGAFVSDLVLQILAYVSQTEREFIKQRQSEGILAARCAGKKLGRKRNILPDEFQKVCEQCIAGMIPTRKAAEILKMSHSTFYRRMKEFVNK